MVRSEKAISSSVYSVELEAQAQAWTEAVTGEPFTDEFGEELRDGRRLCALMNAVRPGSIRRVNTSAIPFKKMENISNFIKACRTVGVPEYSLFETVDLFELKDLGLVVNCLHALGGAVQVNCLDFSGPHLGLKPAASQNKVPSPKTWSSPSSGKPARSINAPAHEPRAQRAAPTQDGVLPTARSSPHPPAGQTAAATPVKAAFSPPPHFDESATSWSTASEGQLPPPPAYGEHARETTPPRNDAAATDPGDISARLSQTMRVTDSHSRVDSTSPRSNGVGNGQHARNMSPPPKPAASGVSRPAQSRSKSPPHNASTSATSTSSVQSASPPRSESMSLSPRSAASSATPRSASKVRGGGYGLDAELAEKREANYDYQSEQEAQEWIEAVTGEAFADEFGEELRNGRRLCLLINAIKPGSVRRVNDSRMPFKQMENVSNFLKACRAVGVAEHSLFETVDLFEGKDLGLVVRCLHALGQTVQKTCPDYNGPRLGIKQTDANKREWTPEQQQQQMLTSSGAMSQLMAGSSKTMERGAIIKQGVTFGSSMSGKGDTTIPARWTTGSQATMERATISKSGPTFGAEYAGTGDSSSSSSMFTRGYR